MEGFVEASSASSNTVDGYGYTADGSIDNTEGVGAFEDIAHHFVPGSRNFDCGGGRFDACTRYLASLRVDNAVYDPHNRPPEHNAAVLTETQQSSFDTATSMSVLNVIERPETRIDHIALMHRALKPGAKAFFKVWAGDRSGVAVRTEDKFQRNATAEAFVDEIASVFGKQNVVADVDKNLIVATKGPLVVDTSSGQVAGRVDDSGLCRVWLGVPYGSASRFRPASTAARWSGVRNATEFGAACMQPPLPGVSLLSEDCLFLNVFAPLQTPAALLPVIVFVHGGGFQVGASNNYNGSVLAGASDTPVIVVTINYRLNIFGFFYLDDTDVTGINIGMQDQRLALQWVQQNIANFGGDPSRVTIMGESAGSVSAFLHLVDKQSWPLFSSIIGESAGPAVWPTAASVRTQFESYATKFGCSDLACMQALPAQSITPFLPMGLSPFVYVWSELILPYPPQIMVALNMTRPNTPALVGLNANEATFLSFLYLNYTLQPPSQALFEQIHAAQLALYDPRALKIAAKYYAWDGNNSMQNFYNTAAPLADLVITCSSEIAASAVGAFRYFWTVAPKKFILTQAGLGATHTCEIPFFFGTGAVFGFEFTPEEAVLAATTAKIVRNFAATGQAPWDKDDVHVFKLDGDNPPPVYDHHCDLWQEILLAKP